MVTQLVKYYHALFMEIKGSLRVHHWSQCKPHASSPRTPPPPSFSLLHLFYIILSIRRCHILSHFLIMVNGTEWLKSHKNHTHQFAFHNKKDSLQNIYTNTCACVCVCNNKTIQHSSDCNSLSRPPAVPLCCLLLLLSSMAFSMTLYDRG
jgi:hypothetical protein